MRADVPDVIREALKATALPWSLEAGGKHIKIKLDGRLVGVLPRSGSKADFLATRANKNIASQVRQMAAKIRGV